MAMECWRARAPFRKERTRNKNYTFGRQWDDVITVDGRRMTEEEYIVSQGNIPLKNNLLRRIVRNVLGVFRARLKEWGDALGDGERARMEGNGLFELYSRTMEEFLISGMAVHKKWVGRRGGVAGVWTEQVSPESFFFDSACRDVRGWDATIVGELHKVGFGSYCDAFIKTRRDYEALSAVFPRSSSGRVCVLELWRRERRPRRIVHDAGTGRVMKVEEGVWQRNRELRRHPSKWVLDNVWRYYFIDMEGNILQQGDSPYLHGGHPYVFKCYPFLDGEIHSFVNDIIDQQKYTNRLITLYDWIMRASAKGVLLMPEGAVDPEDMRDVVNQWSKFNGVIVYRPKAGMPEPKQVSSNTANVGINELLDIQLKMLEDVSGVTGALQGKLASNSVSGTLYNQQTENALTSLSDLLGTFFSFMEEALAKDRRLLRQLSAAPRN